MGISQCTSTAPASIGNVGVGFDILGLGFPVAHDTVRARKAAGQGVTLGAVTGLVERLPEAWERNTALRAGHAVLEAAGHPFAVEMDIAKGVPVSSGMGGSAASAVAGAVAVNALLDTPFDQQRLLEFSFEGERASADPPPIDNVAASLYGGLVLMCTEDPLRVTRLPVPRDIICVLVHPDIEVETRRAREVLSDSVPLATAVHHSRNVALFVSGCHSGNEELLRLGLRDVLIEPQRRQLVPVLGDVQAAAMAAGALGCSLSGSGPSMFAWAMKPHAEAVRAAMSGALDAAGLGHRSYAAPVEGQGARILPREAPAFGSPAG